MAFTTDNNMSTIGTALNGATASVDIPKPYNHMFWNGKASFAAVAARSPPGKGAHPGLPTPPNSISPTLPPQTYKRNDSAAPPTPPAHGLADSDIDLQDAVDHAKAQDQPQRSLGLSPDNGDLGGLDTTGAITPTLLAKHHLPEILLNHGPLAIRHVMGYLTTCVPGFSGIPPAKARRLVVGALEGRGSGGEGGGLLGDVEFEKVGWGRWDARRRGCLAKNDRGIRRASPVTTRHQHHSFRSPSPFSQGGMRIPRAASRSARNRPTLPPSLTPLTYESLQHHDRRANREDPETEADKMSLDDGSCSSSEAPDDGPILEDDLGDITDEEDWASIGAAALRAGSFPSGGGGRIYSVGSHTSRYPKHGGSYPVRRALATSMPALAGRAHAHSHLNRTREVTECPMQQHTSTDLNMRGSKFLSQDIGNDLQEREAVEALVRLSSV